jgi:hypothetical protein
MNTFLTYIFENKEWIFSGIGVFIISAFVAELRIRPNRQEEYHQEAPKVQGDSTAAEIPKTKDSPQNVVEYVANIPLDQNITSDELSILKRFCAFPRSQFTQGYRLDWIYNELISEFPASTVHLYLEKGVTSRARPPLRRPGEDERIWV